MIRTRPRSFFDRIIAWSFDQSLSTFAWYLVAVLAVVTVGVLRTLLITDALPWLLFIPTALAVALVAGIGPGLFAACLSAVVGSMTIAREHNPILLNQSQVIAALLFLIVTCAIVMLAGELRASMRRARDLNRELVASEAAAASEQAFLSSVLAASTDCIKVLEVDGTLSFMSEGGMKVMEISDFNTVRGCPWPAFLQDDGPGYAKAALEAAVQGKTTHFEAPANTYLGSPRHWSVSVSPIPDASGKITRILSVSRDHTELQKAREQQKLLNGELAHRNKNIMSVVQAIAYQTLGKGVNQEALSSFSKRLAALSSAQDVLTRDQWSEAKLADVARVTLETFGQDNFVLSGPEVEIAPRATLAVSLMLHELATNAAKYGALTVPGGKVSVSWRIQQEGEETLLGLSWEEQGGPPAAEPTRKGFGSKIINMGLNGSGGVTLVYGSQGFSMNAVAPLYQMQEA